jgi:hypothetical protein
VANCSEDCQEPGPFDWPPKRIEDNYRRACQWRATRILCFAEQQTHKRNWIRFTELAERERLRVSALDNIGNHFNIYDGYRAFREAILAGRFETQGRSRILYLHPLTTKARMTREFLEHVMEWHPTETVGRQYLGCCWLPRDLAIAWCESRNIAASAEWLVQPLRPAKRRGRRHLDDSAALAIMARHRDNGFRIGAAARVAMATVGRTANNDKAEEYRLCRKFRRGFKR